MKTPKKALVWNIFMSMWKMNTEMVRLVTRWIIDSFITHGGLYSCVVASRHLRPNLVWFATWNIEQHCVGECVWKNESLFISCCNTKMYCLKSSIILMSAYSGWEGIMFWSVCPSVCLSVCLPIKPYGQYILIEFINLHQTWYGNWKKIQAYPLGIRLFQNFRINKYFTSWEV